MFDLAEIPSWTSWSRIVVVRPPTPCEVHCFRGQLAMVADEPVGSPGGCHSLLTTVTYPGSGLEQGLWPLLFFCH